MSRHLINPCTPWVAVGERREFFRLYWGTLEVATMKDDESREDDAQAIDPPTLGDDDIAFDLALQGRLRALNFTGKIFDLDGLPTHIFDFVEVNRLEIEEVERISELDPGASITYGGGAAATFVLTRAVLAGGKRVKVGDRVELARDVDRYDAFIAKKGLRGTISEISEYVVTVLLDEHLDGAEEWDNNVCWGSSDQLAEFDEDVRLLDQTSV